MAERILCPEKFTYSGATGNFSSAASATDIFEIKGATSKKIQVLSVVLSASQTTGGQVVVDLLKRSTANTAGTAVATTKVPHNTAYAASTATVQHYTANPTTGSLVGKVASNKVYVPATTEVIQPFVEWNFELMFGAPIILMDATQSLVVNLGGVTVTGGSFNVTVTWIEEPT